MFYFVAQKRVIKDVKKRLCWLLFVVCVTGCVNVPDGIEPVDQFELQRYLGRWYEVARLDHSFERGLNSVTASYSLRDDGGVEVINRGFAQKDSQWREAKGKAYFVNEPSEGFLKVSFFGPFYGAYVIFELDKNYQHAFVAGPNKSYLWLLSRTPSPPQSVIDQFTSRASMLGFDISELIFVDHTANRQSNRVSP